MAARITDAQRLETARLTGEGWTIRAIAEKLGISVGSVKLIRKRAQKAASAPPHPPQPEAIVVAPSDVMLSDEQLATELRHGLVSQARRLGRLTDDALEVVADAVATGNGVNARNMAVAYGVLADKRLMFVRAAKEMSPRSSAPKVRPSSPIVVDDGGDAHQVH